MLLSDFDASIGILASRSLYVNQRAIRFHLLLVTFWAAQEWPNMRSQSFCCLVSIADEAGGYDDPSLCCCRSATREKPPTKDGTESKGQCCGRQHFSHYPPLSSWAIPRTDDVPSRKLCYTVNVIVHRCLACARYGARSWAARPLRLS